mgnify:CR=1 FL=1
MTSSKLKYKRVKITWFDIKLDVSNVNVFPRAVIKKIEVIK